MTTTTPAKYVVATP